MTEKTYIAKKTTANIAQTLVINRAVNDLGESTWTAAWKRTAHTSLEFSNISTQTVILRSNLSTATAKKRTKFHFFNNFHSNYQ